MKYAVTYTKSFRYYNDVDEVIFPFRGEGDLIEIVTKTLTREDQKAIIRIADNPLGKNINEFIPILNKLKTIHSNILISIDFYNQKDYIEVLKENNLPFMFANFASNLSVVCGMDLLGAEDIYIAEDLCFNLKLLQSIRAHGKRLRIWPDIAQVHTGCNPPLPQITNFFIRPEDLHLYSSLVDVIEIFRQDERVSVVYEIYKQEQWKGDLNTLVLSLSDSIPNTGILPDFGQARLTCKKRCTYSNCDICTETLKIANILEENDIGIIKQKKKAIVDLDAIKQAEDMLNKEQKEEIDGFKVNEEFVLSTQE